MAVKSGNGYARKQRNSGSRKRKSVVLLATEGKNQTETQYFKDMAKSLYRVVRFVPGNYTDPVNIASMMKQYYTEWELTPELGDRAYCLIDADCDSQKDKQILKANSIAKEVGFEVAVSAPCFEIWLLCHFSHATKQYSSNSEVISDLTKKLPGYTKSTSGIFAKTKDRIEIAVNNAKLLEKACIDAGYCIHTAFFSPSTEVYKVVEELKRQKNH